MDDTKLTHALKTFFHHRQHYNGSCVASCVEIVLKIENRVPLGFREIQDQHQLDSEGMTPFYSDAFVSRFRLKFRPMSFSPVSLEGIFDVIDAELEDSRFPMISLFGGSLDSAAGTMSGHMYVIVQRIGNDYLALSKRGFLTIGQLVAQSAQHLESTNLYLYELLADRKTA